MFNLNFVYTVDSMQTPSNHIAEPASEISKNHSNFVDPCGQSQRLFKFIDIHSLKLTARSWNGPSQKETIVFQAYSFRCKLLPSGRVINSFLIKKRKRKPLKQYLVGGFNPFEKY